MACPKSGRIGRDDAQHDAENPFVGRRDELVNSGIKVTGFEWSDVRIFNSIGYMMPG